MKRHQNTLMTKQYTRYCHSYKTQYIITPKGNKYQRQKFIMKGLKKLTI